MRIDGTQKDKLVALATTFLMKKKMRLSRSSLDHRMEMKFTNKNFIDVICNEVWSSSELLTEVNHWRTG